MNIGMGNRQAGQSMVEYVVVLMALTAALLYTDYTTRSGESLPKGYIGTSESDQGSLIQAINQKHRGHSYALSLSEIPETDDLQQLKIYYDSLNKYPQFSPQLGSIASKIGQVSSNLNKVTNTVNQLKKYIPPNLGSPGGMPGLP